MPKSRSRKRKNNSGAKVQYSPLIKPALSTENKYKPNGKGRIGKFVAAIIAIIGIVGSCLTLWDSYLITVEQKHADSNKPR